jgi:hypothetical protein
LRTARRGSQNGGARSPGGVRGGAPAFLVLVLVLVLVLDASARTPESEYSKRLAARIGGVCEVRNGDGTRIDVANDVYAVEVEFANKWAESVGQALHYGIQSGKRPAILLVLETRGDLKHAAKLLRIAQHYKLDLTIWITEADEFGKEEEGT